MNEGFLSTDRLTVGYNKIPLISDICLAVGRGEILAVIGPNGAGKSTILKSIIRRLAPLGGTVYLGGEDLSTLSGAAQARLVASVQPGRISAELLTVEDIVSMGRYPYTGTLGILSPKDRQVVKSAMRQLDIDELAQRDFSALSDGQRQRVILARALAQEPELLVLDEPAAYLDIKYQLELADILRTLAREKQLTVVLSLHEIELAKRLADRVVCVKKGEIAAYGAPEDVLAPERIDVLFGLESGAYKRYLGQDHDREAQHYILADGKRLRCGFTTGSCAALAAQASAMRLLMGAWPKAVSLKTPKGWSISAEPEQCDADETSAVCAIRKDAGDDPDRTDGMLIFARGSLTAEPGVTIDGGEGIGRVTKPGLDRSVGEAAINSVPRQMITDAVMAVFRSADYTGGMKITISAPGGEEIAAHTFNPMLGIEGGISILGTSGIVEPMSTQALVDTIAVELRQAKAEGCDTVLLTPGNYGLEYLKSRNFVPEQLPVIRCSNYIGDALDLCGEMGFSAALIVGNIGKLVKLAGGIMNTHSRTADCRMEFFCAYAALCGGGTELCERLMACATTDACIAELEAAGLRAAVMRRLTASVQQKINRRTEGRLRAGALIFSNVYGELGRTETAAEIISEWQV